VYHSPHNSIPIVHYKCTHVGKATQLSLAWVVADDIQQDDLACERTPGFGKRVIVNWIAIVLPSQEIVHHSRYKRIEGLRLSVIIIFGFFMCTKMHCMCTNDCNVCTKTHYMCTNEFACFLCALKRIICTLMNLMCTPKSEFVIPFDFVHHRRLVLVPGLVLIHLEPDHVNIGQI
jgi:hypothetical protein